MKRGLYLFVTVLGCGLALANAEAQTRYNSQPGKSSVKVDGSSTFHDWEMEGAVIGGFIELGNGVGFDEAKGAITGLQDGKMPATVRANINIKAIHSKADHLPEVMDHLMQEHLQAEAYPSIRFQAKSLALTNAAAGKPFAFTATGDLSIAGVTNSVTFPVTIEQPDAAHLHVAGTASLKMTDFKIDPPAPKVAGLPTMKCGDDITITIGWTLQKRAGQ
jgi:polyisoprenoid-binding protein YceI